MSTTPDLDPSAAAPGSVPPGTTADAGGSPSTASPSGAPPSLGSPSGASPSGGSPSGASPSGTSPYGADVRVVEPTGPALGTLVWGCTALAVGVLLALWEVADVRVDVGLAVPVGMVALGLLLVVGAVVTALRRR